MTNDDPSKDDEIVPDKNGKFIIKDPALLDKVTGGASAPGLDGSDPEDFHVNAYACVGAEGLSGPE